MDRRRIILGVLALLFVVAVLDFRHNPGAAFEDFFDGFWVRTETTNPDAGS